METTSITSITSTEFNPEGPEMRDFDTKTPTVKMDAYQWADLGCRMKDIQQQVIDLCRHPVIRAHPDRTWWIRTVLNRFDEVKSRLDSAVFNDYPDWWNGVHVFYGPQMTMKPRTGCQFNLVEMP